MFDVNPGYPSDFNPHTREECDQQVTGRLCICTYFNPHTREECDAGGLIAYGVIKYFNPHTREECDAVCPWKLTSPE